MKVKWGALIAIIILCVLGVKFISSHEISTVDNLAYVLGISFDITDEDKIKATFQFLQTIGSQEEGVSEEVPSIIDTAEGDTIAEVFNLINVYSSKQLEYCHCNMIVFSEEFAKRGLEKELETLINNNEIRPTIKMLISRCDASSYLKQSKPALEKLVTKHYNTFPLETKYTGYVDYMNIGDFYNNVISGVSGNTAILANVIPRVKEEGSTGQSPGSDSGEGQSQGQGSAGGSGSGEGQSQGQGSAGGSGSEGGQSQGQGSAGGSGSGEGQGQGQENASEGSETTTVQEMEELAPDAETMEGERGAENIGTAVFKRDKMIGNLTAIETIMHLLVNNKVDTFTLAIPISQDKSVSENSNTVEEVSKSDNKIVMSFLQKNKTKVYVDTSNNVPKVRVEVSLDASITSKEKLMTSIDSFSIEDVENVCNEYIKGEFLKYFNRLTKEFDADIDNIGRLARTNFWTIQDLESYNWNEKFKDAEFDVKVNTAVDTGLNIVEPNTSD